MKYFVLLLRYIRGYVVFKAEKGFIERFINLCTGNGIHIWNIKVEENILTASIALKNFKKLRPSVRKSGVKITVVKKIGLAFRLRQYNKRIGLAIGIILFFSLHLIMNQFVWCIDVSGNQTISKDEIILQAENFGLVQGKLKSSFNEVKAAREMAAYYDGKVPWLTINIKGSLAVIELREENKTIENTEDNSPCNIVADFDGVILSVETMRGDAAVKMGNGVKKGDLLISGVIVNEDMSTTYYKAKGKISAIHNENIMLNKKLTGSLKGLTETDKSYTLGFLGIEIPIGKLKEDDNLIILSDKRNLKINGYNLPFYITENHGVTVSEDNSAPKGNYIHSFEEINFEVYALNKNSTVVNKQEKMQRNAGTYIYSGDYTLIDFIGKEKPILSDSEN